LSQRPIKRTASTPSRADLRLARGLGAPRANPHLAQGLGARSSESPPRSRARCPLGRISAPLEGEVPPRANVCLARGACAHSPDQGIKCSDTTRVPGSKANPRHAGPLTPPGNQIPVLFCQPSLSGHPWHCTGLCSEASVNSVTLCRPLPYDLRAAPLEGGRRNPRKWYGRLLHTHKGRRSDVELVERVSSEQLRSCAAIPTAVLPSRALQRHPRCCGNLGQQDVTTPAAVRPPAFRQPNPRAGVRTTTKQDDSTVPPSKPLLDEHRIRCDVPPEHDSPGRPPFPWSCTPYRHT
jgi:hypothetical protein